MLAWLSSNGLFCTVSCEIVLQNILLYKNINKFCPGKVQFILSL